MNIKGVLLGIYFTLLAGFAHSADFIEVADLTADCYFNKEGKSLPYIKNNGINPDAIHFYLDLKRYQGNYLEIKHSFPFALFIEGELKEFTKDKTDVRWKIDSLSQSLHKGRVLITIFSSQKSYDNLRVSIVKDRIVGIKANDFYSIEKKNGIERNVFLVIVLLLTVFLSILINTNQKAFADFYSIDLLLVGRIKDESIFKSKLFSQENLLIYLFHSALLSFLLLVLIHFSNGIIDRDLLLLNSKFFSWFLNSFLILGFFIAKYLFVRYLGILFDLGQAANYYFYEFMRISMFFFLLIFILISLCIISFPSLADGLINVCIYAIIIFLVFRFIILFNRIGSMASFKKFHLFSYLCTTESIPIIIGIKYLIF